MLRCVLAADHAGVRTGLRMLLEDHPACTIVGEAASGPEALALTQRLQPDVLLLDLAQTAAERLEVIHRLRADVPTTSVVVLSMFADEGQMRALEHAGAAAVVLKQAPSAALIASIEQARAGRH